MGYIRHKALLVNAWSSEELVKAHSAVLAVYADTDHARLISPIVQHVCNGGASFFIAPDGSKEGWSDSDIGDELMAKAKAAIKAFSFADWCEVECGGDDERFAVLDCSTPTPESSQ